MVFPKFAEPKQWVVAKAFPQLPRRMLPRNTVLAKPDYFCPG